MGNLRPMSATPPASVTAESHQVIIARVRKHRERLLQTFTEERHPPKRGVLRNGRLGADLLVETRSMDKKTEPRRRLGQDNAFGSAGHRVGSLLGGRRSRW